MDARQECLEILKEKGINPISSIDFEVNGELHSLSFEWIIDAYTQASAESQLVFLTALKKAIGTNNMGIEKFFEGMGKLILMTHLSKNIEL
ncbi:hypothetical protein [Sulfurimonas sp. HSL3-2]|jgi:hypothetical protein|uniref:hypothetical protein n=1 Tax=Hydrocurvibacter mobilis TaxID=3131936 RepID=UPI0031F8B6DE